MSSEKRVLLICLGVLFFSVFLPFFIASEKADIPLRDRAEAGIFASDDGGDKGQVLMESCLRPQSGNSRVQLQRKNSSGAIRLHAELAVLMQLLILLFQGKYCLAAYPDYQMPVARFLWDLFARQRKDGKKRGLIFSM